ncbi:MAG: hypothetical protein NBV67_11875 [Tagaea sp.]|nr:hypothetical protein [Tagaea sp.]
MSLSISSSFASAINYGDIGALYQSGGFDPANEVELGRDRVAERNSTEEFEPTGGAAAVAQAGAAGGGNISARGIDPSSATETAPAYLPPPPQASGRGQFVDLSV